MVVERHPAVRVEAGERLAEADEPEVVEHLDPEAGVDHVHRRVVDAADVEVDGVPVVDDRAVERRGIARSHEVEQVIAGKKVDGRAIAVRYAPNPAAVGPTHVLVVCPSEDARAAGCTDIARQMIEAAHGDGPRVLMGGGRTQFMPANQADPEYPDRTGQRGDHGFGGSDPRQAHSGRVVETAVGEPIDNRGPITAGGGYRPIHREPPLFVGRANGDPGVEVAAGDSPRRARPLRP